MSRGMLFTAALFCGAALAHGSVKSEMFQAKPGSGQSEVSITSDSGVTCVFSFACNGGTGETWEISISDDTCTVYNLSGDGVSYLYFEFAKMEVNRLIESAFGDPEDMTQYTQSHESIKSSTTFSHSVHKLGVKFKHPEGKSEL